MGSRSGPKKSSLADALASQTGPSNDGLLSLAIQGETKTLSEQLLSSKTSLHKSPKKTGSIASNFGAKKLAVKSTAITGSNNSHLQLSKSNVQTSRGALSVPELSPSAQRRRNSNEEETQDLPLSATTDPAEDELDNLNLSTMSLNASMYIHKWLSETQAEAESHQMIFAASVSQSTMFNALHPPPEDDLHHSSHHDSQLTSTRAAEKFHVVQCYEAKGICAWNLDHAVAALLPLVQIHPFLRVRPFRNDLILDADVQLQFDKVAHDASDMDDRLFEMIPVQGSQHEEQTAIAKQIQRWYDSEEPAELPLKVFLFTHSQTRQHKVVFIMSKIIADEVSCTILAREWLHRMDKQPGVSALSAEMVQLASLQHQLMDHYISYHVEQVPYNIAHGKAANKMIRQEFVDIVAKAQILDSERSRTTAEIAKLEQRVAKLYETLQQLKGKSSRLSNEITMMADKRKQLDEVVVSKVFSLADAVTGERFEVTETQYKALVDFVLGSGADTEANIVPFLTKHGISNELQFSIGASFMTVKRFLQVSEGDKELANVLTSERKKLFALVNHVKARLREITEENSKLRMTLERSIIKSKRELVQTDDAVRSTRKEIDNFEHDIVKLSSLLDQTVETNFVVPAAVRESMSTGSSASILAQKASTVEAETPAVNHFRPYDYVAVRFEPTILASIKDYIEHTADTNLDCEVDASFVFLAALATLMKHTTGRENFVMGLHVANRPNDDTSMVPLIGPWSKFLPLKFETAQTGVTLMDVAEESKRSLKELEETMFGICGDSWRAELQRAHLIKNAQSFPIPVHFQHIRAAEWAHFQQQGVRFEDLISRGGDTVEEGVEGLQLWSHDGEEPFDMKLLIVEESSGDLRGGFLFRPDDELTHAKVQRWAERLENVLSNVEHGGLRVALSALIGRFYQKVWSSGNSLNVVL